VDGRTTPHSGWWTISRIRSRSNRRDACSRAAAFGHGDSADRPTHDASRACEPAASPRHVRACHPATTARDARQARLPGWPAAGNIHRRGACFSVPSSFCGFFFLGGEQMKAFRSGSPTSNVIAAKNSPRASTDCGGGRSASGYSRGPTAGARQDAPRDLLKFVGEARGGGLEPIE